MVGLSWSGQQLKRCRPQEPTVLDRDSSVALPSWPGFEEYKNREHMWKKNSFFAWSIDHDCVRVWGVTFLRESCGKGWEWIWIRVDVQLTGVHWQNKTDYHADNKVDQRIADCAKHRSRTMNFCLHVCTIRISNLDGLPAALDLVLCQLLKHRETSSFTEAVESSVALKCIMFSEVHRSTVLADL